MAESGVGVRRWAASDVWAMTGPVVKRLGVYGICIAGIGEIGRRRTMEGSGKVKDGPAVGGTGTRT